MKRIARSPLCVLAEIVRGELVALAQEGPVLQISPTKSALSISSNKYRYPRTQRWRVRMCAEGEKRYSQHIAVTVAARANFERERGRAEVGGGRNIPATGLDTAYRLYWLVLTT